VWHNDLTAGSRLVKAEDCRTHMSAALIHCRAVSSICWVLLSFFHFVAALLSAFLDAGYSVIARDKQKMCMLL